MTEKQILKSSLKLFNERGYHDVGMREIARELNLSPGNVTYYFKKKDDILFTLLQEYSEQNTTFYEKYHTESASIAGFLGLMKNIFYSQYQYRGVYIGNYIVQKEFQSTDSINYKSTSERRKQTFQKMFTDLRAEGHINANDDDIDFLVSFITLFGRFWISEATIFDKSPDVTQAIKHYIRLLVKELSLFATERGKLSIEQFKKEEFG
ncbi:MAG: TetR/AcrR family transcriptional regulator [Saprospiraceae bacterium]|nr:TetR/AcrR family transcriptional regulator [Saprospiraceae bacterium]MBK7523013.1 TetR/AcrR family transcriptional regulator [Saprospiraceae bacterium]MBK8854536.1 TetR/AcrR family transcriptional regulator [Saprospiraceae bacterium]MBK9044507.1 TetR/AcrR family transcriptional regulator [Saprospiraceae bacterium]